MGLNALAPQGRAGVGNEGPRSSRRLLVVFIGGLSFAAVAMAFAAGRLPGAPSSQPSEAVALLLLLVLAGFLGLEFRVRGEGDRLDLFDAAVAAALVSLPGPELLALVVVAKGIALTAQRVAPIKTVFNIAQWSCATAAGSLVFAALRPSAAATPRDVLVLAVALAVVAAINAAAVQLVLTAVVGRPRRQAGTPRLVRGVAVGTAVNLLLGLLAGALWDLVPVTRLVIPLALLSVHLGGRLWAQRQVGSSRLVGLERASAVLAGAQDLASAAPRFLTELRQAFQCAGVELHLKSGRDDAWTRLTSGYDSGAERTQPLIAELLRRRTAVRLAPPEIDPELRGLLAEAGWRDGLAAPVHRQGQVVGFLCSHDREGWEGFESAELAVLEAAAGVLGEALQRAELMDVLREERAALHASEIRWRAVARVLELVARGTPLPQTLDLLARTVEEQVRNAHCVVVVRAPGQPPAVASPSLTPAAAAAVEQVLLPKLSKWPTASQMWARDLLHRPTGQPLPEADDDALREVGIHGMQVWGLPCSPSSGAIGALALCHTADSTLTDDASLVDGAAHVAGLAVDHLLVQDRLAHQAGHDPLTDLPNRALFLDRLGHALRISERDGTSVLVLFLDIDRFKMVNDSLGHRAGDTLLDAVAARLRAAVRPGDTVARFGGDEFTILCEGIEDEAHALQVVQRVQAGLTLPFPLRDGELFATSSIGIALGRGRAQSAETLVEDADAAMYRAKERGGNCFELFDDAMRERAVRRLSTQSALHRALERAEFRVVYQPTVRLSTGEVEGVEALIRWDRPEHGLVQPAEFVPLAEESGLIVPIGGFVLNEACRQARLWRDGASTIANHAGHLGSQLGSQVSSQSGHDVARAIALSVSVNLSARQLTDPGLVPLVRDALERNDVDGGMISLEITETGLMNDVGASSSVLAELKGLGVRLYVDDFGTGYSSLTYLQRFPVDGIKVDRSFVSGLGSRPGDAAIVRGVIGLAHGLGLVAIAEGVETKDQLNRLIDLECDVAQGYYLGRPAPPDQVIPVDVRGPRVNYGGKGHRRAVVDVEWRRSG